MCDYNWHSTGYGCRVSWILQESPQECAVRLRNFLTGFIKLFPGWLPYHIASTMRSCYVPLTEVPSTQQLEESLIITRDKKLTEAAAIAAGSFFYISNEYPNTAEKYKRYVKITIRCCASPPRSNTLLVQFPPAIEENSDLVDAKHFERLFDLLINCWNPFQGYVAPLFLDEKLDVSEIVVGWKTFYAKEKIPLPNLPSWVKVSPSINDGVLLTLSDHLLNENDEKDMAKVKEVDAILRPFILGEDNDSSDGW